MAADSHEFYDINQFPQEEGMLVFGISMSKISNAQSAEKYFEYVTDIIPKIVRTNGVGATFLYSDYLYMHTDQGNLPELRTKYQTLMLGHKNSFLTHLNKKPQLIRKSFDFLTWGQLLINCRKFDYYFSELKRLYQADPLFQKYVRLDAENGGKEFSHNQANFFLEESLMLYLISKGEIPFYNEYIEHREKWILNCYPGKPLRTETYVYQKNFFDLERPTNKFENCYYDLEEKILYDFNKIDLETFKFV